MNKNFQHLNQYYIIGITGVIGSGKSFLSHYLKSYYQANIIEIDTIRRDMLWNSFSSQSVQLRKELTEEFCIEKYDSQYFFDRTSFTQFIFSNIHFLNKFNVICKPYFKEAIKNLLISERLNCVVWVNLIEDDYLDMIEYMIYVNISQDKWNQFNQGQKIVTERLNTQLDLVSKKTLLKNLPICYEVFENE